MSDNWIIVATTLGGLAFGASCASLLYLRFFVNILKQLHQDNVSTAELLIKSDDNRASEVQTTAVDLAAADENVTRKVTEGNGVGK